MKKICLKIISLFFIFSLFLMSCNNEIHDEFPSDKPMVDYYSLIEALGFDNTTVVEEPDYFIIEGDIRIDKEELLNYFTTPSTRQARTEFLVSLENRLDLGIYIAPNIPETWKTATRNAMNNWNSQKGLYMREVSATNADIKINIETLGGDVVAFAQFPTNEGKVGNYIVINSTYSPQYNLSQATYVMTHELGHCFGFRHTNWEAKKEDPGIGIAGTPNLGENPDPESIMNSEPGRNKLSWNGFSYYDKIAIQNLYPDWKKQQNGLYTYTFVKDEIVNVPNNNTLKEYIIKVSSELYWDGMDYGISYINAEHIFEGISDLPGYRISTQFPPSYDGITFDYLLEVDYYGRLKPNDPRLSLITFFRSGKYDIRG